MTETIQLTAEETDKDVVFITKDSGQRATFHSGMVRDIQDNKLMFHAVMEGPMFGRWVALLTRGKKKYPDDPDGTANWTKANSIVEWLRFRTSAFRHFIQWFIGCKDEDHAAAVFFNINGAVYTDEFVTEEQKNKVYSKYKWLLKLLEKV